jgi:hypothetical protein
MGLIWHAHRYLLRVTVTRSYGGSIVRDFFFWVRNYAAAPPPSTAPPIKARARCCCVAPALLT